MSRVRGPFEKQLRKREQTLFKSGSQQIYHIDWPLETKLCSKKSLLLTYQILGPLVNTLAANEMYPVLNRDNLTIQIHMQLSQKLKKFSTFFSSILEI